MQTHEIRPQCRAELRRRWQGGGATGNKMDAKELRVSTDQQVTNFTPSIQFDDNLIFVRLSNGLNFGTQTFC